MSCCCSATYRLLPAVPHALFIATGIEALDIDNTCVYYNDTAPDNPLLKDPAAASNPGLRVAS